MNQYDSKVDEDAIHTVTIFKGEDEAPTRDLAKKKALNFVRKARKGEKPYKKMVIESVSEKRVAPENEDDPKGSWRVVVRGIHKKG